MASLSMTSASSTTSSSSSSSASSRVEVRLLDMAGSGIKGPKARWRSAYVAAGAGIRAEEAAVSVCRHSLNVRPLSAPLFGLRTKGSAGFWLAPNQRLDALPREAFPLELRVRFKTPLPSKLLDLDRQAFLYYYHQISHDFSQGCMVRSYAASRQHKKPGGRKTPWWIPAIGTVDSEEDARRVEVYSMVVRLASLAMTVDVLDLGGRTSAKEVVKNAHMYIPKEIYASLGEKMVGSSKVRGIAESLVEDQLSRKTKSATLKEIFLADMESESMFRDYFDEMWKATVRSHNNVGGGSRAGARLVFRPPMKSNREPFEESEPRLVVETPKSSSSSKGGGDPTEWDMSELCALEEMCNISMASPSSSAGVVGDEEEACRVELSRKNGIPVYLSFASRAECLSFVSHVSGYYRLCEKWNFCLCTEVSYPSLDFCMANNLHGPVTAEFVEEKFKLKSKQTPGSYILRQSCEKYDTYYIHYISAASAAAGARPDILRVVLAAADKDGTTPMFWLSGGAGGVRQQCFSSLKDLVRSLKGTCVSAADAVAGIPMSSDALIRDCLHPSENDKAPTLLLCRAIERLRADMLGGAGVGAASGDKAAAEEERRDVVPFRHISKFEDERWAGTFTTVWRSKWRGRVVAFKQLQKKYQYTRVMDFMPMCYDMLMWDDSTLVKSYGVCLFTHANPMALVQEFFPLGPLHYYLKENGLRVEEVDLVEACTSLSRAVWYLDDNRLVHGNIRCKNVFVAEHSEAGFKVKLGDPGILEYYPPSQVHWLPLELLLVDCPTPQHCKDAGVKADVWALATTFWQIFSDGASPGGDPHAARDAYKKGHRLERPVRLKGYLFPIYEVMRDCWNPSPDLRKDPQSVMRDVNQLLYRVFNSRKVHTYVDIEDGPQQQGGRGGNYVSCVDSSISSTLTEVTGIGTATTNGHENGLSSPAPFLTSTPVPTEDPPVLPPPLANGQYRRPSTAPPSTDTASANYSRLGNANLVPTFNHMMERFFEHRQTQNPDLLRNFGRMAMAAAGNRGRSDSLDPLLNSSLSRPGSSLESSVRFLQHSESQLTSQTSLASFSTLYSTNSIYQINSESQLELNTEFPLGEGNFGVVYKGVMSRSNGEWDQVAVKMLKDSGSGGSISSPGDSPALANGGQQQQRGRDAAAEEMQRELDIMRSLNHENVVKIKGVFQGCDSRVILIMEYVREGSLDRYLYANRDAIKFPKQLFIFAQNIVEGMEYLGSKNIIHRDLAARNILVAGEDLVKISDFGLARSVYEEHYVMSSNTNIPVKWLALECLTHKLYSVASDVWAFGVTLWEMFSFGASPAFKGCESFFRAGATDEQHQEDMAKWVQYLGDGIRMPCPDGCPSAVYSEVMLPCWAKDPKARPSFAELRDAVAKTELQVT